MITVLTGAWGEAAKYGDEVRSLQRQVERHLEEEHEFYCISDREIPGVRTIPKQTPWPGWWEKVGLFRMTGDIPGCEALWLDLDVVVTGGLDAMLEPVRWKCMIAAPSNWARSGHGGVQSSVLYFQPRMSPQVYDLFDERHVVWPPVNRPGFHWGDQEHLTEMRDSGRVDFKEIPAEFVKSYKYHCQDGSWPEGASVIAFHGRPKPTEVRDPWVIEARA